MKFNTKTENMLQFIKLRTGDKDNSLLNPK